LEAIESVDQNRRLIELVHSRDFRRQSFRATDEEAANEWGEAIQKILAELFPQSGDTGLDLAAEMKHAEVAEKKEGKKDATDAKKQALKAKRKAKAAPKEEVLGCLCQPKPPFERRVGAQRARERAALGAARAEVKGSRVASQPSLRRSCQMRGGKRFVPSTRRSAWNRGVRSRGILSTSVSFCRGAKLTDGSSLLVLPSCRARCKPR